MIISRNFLNNNIKNLNSISNKEIENAIHQLGYEVENFNCQIDNVNQDKFCFGKIIKFSKVINSKKLNLVVVKTKNDILEIICGAQNLKLNHYVVVALTGAKLANNLIIKPKTIFNINSAQMICSYQELGVECKNLFPNEIILLNFENDDILNQKNVLNFLNLNDEIYNIFLPNNRFYALSYYQFIKEIALYLNLEYQKILQFKSTKISNQKNISQYKIDSQINNLEFAFCEYDLNNLQSKNLNINLKHFLLNQGYLNHNLIKSILNYAMMICGQALIFIDLTNINLKKFEFRYIDEKLVFGFLNKENCFIVINRIGSYENEIFNIDSKTQKILVVSFKLSDLDIFKLRKNIIAHNWYLQRILNFKTNFYLEKILQLVKNLFLDHKILKNATLIVKNFHFPLEPNKVLISKNYVNKMLNTNFSIRDIQKILQKFLFKTQIQKNSLIIFNNSNRWMLNSKSEFLEEILRIYGTNNINEEVIQGSICNNLKNYNFKWSRIITNLEKYLLFAHFFQVKTYSLVSEELNQKINFFNYSKPIKLQTPYLQNQETMRMSLLESLFQIYLRNKKNNKINVKLFEINPISFLNNQNWHLGLILEDHFNQIEILKIYKNENIFYLKQILIDLLKILNFKANLKNIKFKKFKTFLFNKYQSAKIFYDDILIGVIGEFNLNLINLKSKNIPVFGIELNLSAIIENLNFKNNFLKLSFFNPIFKDLTIIVKNDFSYLKIWNLNFLNIKYLQQTILKNYFKLDNNLIALTLTLKFNDLNLQLTQIDIKNSLETIYSNLKKNNIKIK